MRANGRTGDCARPCRNGDTCAADQRCHGRANKFRRTTNIVAGTHANRSAADCNERSSDTNRGACDINPGSGHTDGSAPDANEHSCNGNANRYPHLGHVRLRDLARWASQGRRCLDL